MISSLSSWNPSRIPGRTEPSNWNVHQSAINRASGQTHGRRLGRDSCLKNMEMFCTRWLFPDDGVRGPCATKQCISGSTEVCVKIVHVSKHVDVYSWRSIEMPSRMKRKASDKEESGVSRRSDARAGSLTLLSSSRMHNYWAFVCSFVRPFVRIVSASATRQNNKR